jgi:aminoglycoside phosphotransferase (APT) family kinase protein
VHLPPVVRRYVEQRLGCRVTGAESAGAGYTSGFASVLTGEDGRRLFVKAASKKAQSAAAHAYADEVRKLRSLPVGLPVPRLLWAHQDDLWVVLGFEHVDGTAPARPWRTEELARCLDVLETLGNELTPAPPTVRLRPLGSEQEFGGMITSWEQVRARTPDWPHLRDAAALAGRYERALRGETVVHTDARDDNFLLTGDGGVLCDWNWPALGPAWVDTVLLLISASGDGLDADALLAERPLTRDADPEDVDCLLALVCGYFLHHRHDPPRSASPYIRVHQAWYADAAWAWLSRRRGWT